MDLKGNKVSRNIVFFMLIVVAIASLQTIATETAMLSGLWGMTYGQRLDALDHSYYHDYFYRYYSWLDSLLPPSRAFSIFLDLSNPDVYVRYEQKFNYYLYPRQVLPGEAKVFGYDLATTKSIKGIRGVINVDYEDVVFVPSVRSLKIERENGVMSITLNGKKFYLLARLDDKGILVERSMIKKNVLNGVGYKNLRNEFLALYRADIGKAGF